MERLTRGWDWFVERAHGTYTKVWLGVLSFTESSIFVIPPDPLLAAIILAGNKRWLYYAIFTTITSMAGAVFGYLVGALAYDTIGVGIIEWYGWQGDVAAAQEAFAQNTFLFMFLAALTPLPFKAFVLAAGFFKVHFLLFILASLAGRTLRYCIVAYGTLRLGPYAIELTRRYTTPVTVATFVAFILYLLYMFM